MIKDKIIVYPFAISAILLLLSGLVAIAALPVDSGDIIIRFDNYHNEVLWAGSIGTFLGVVAVALAVVVVNFMLAQQIYSKERFIAYLLGAGSLVISTLFVIATFAVTLIN